MIRTTVRGRDICGGLTQFLLEIAVGERGRRAVELVLL
jgi:hypothetical protein